MSEIRNSVAERLERAADRMYNAGFFDEERKYREAAVKIREGLSLEETQALERSMLTNPQHSQIHRLSALAAIGEYDAPDTQATDSDAQDGSVLTDTESGAGQLLSTAVPNGLSDPFSSTQGGWTSSSQDVNPYTGVAADGDDSNPFAEGQNVNPYTGTAENGNNSNPFTSGQNINPFTGDPDTGPFSVGGTPSTGSSWADFGYGGPPPSMLASPGLLAQNDAVAANFNIASDAVGSPNTGFVSLRVGTEDWPYTDTILYQGLETYYRYDSNDGTMYAMQPTDGGPALIYSTIDGSCFGSVTSSGEFVPAANTQTQPDSLPSPQQTMPITQPGATSVATPSAQLMAAIQQAVGPNEPISSSAGPIGSINDVLAGMDSASPSPTQNQPSDQVGSPPGQTIAQQQEDNWSAAKAGMWDSAVDMAQGLLNMSLVPILGPFSPLQPSLDWAKAGPPAPTGNPVRDAQLLDNYKSGGWVTTTISLAAPFGAEGILDSALVASTKLPAVEGMGMGGGGRLIGPTEQWLASFSETSESLAPELGNGLPTGPSFEGVIDPIEFENDPEIIDRLSRARELDIGGYESMTGRGEFGRVGDNLDADEALQNAYIRMMKDVERVSEVTRDNPAIALNPVDHRLIQNMQTAQMQGLSPNEVLQFHLQQMRDLGIAPDYVLQMLEREALRYIGATF